jgi:hypothetical protein
MSKKKARILFWAALVVLACLPLVFHWGAHTVIL